MSARTSLLLPALLTSRGGSVGGSSGIRSRRSAGPRPSSARLLLLFLAEERPDFLLQERRCLSFGIRTPAPEPVAKVAFDDQGGGEVKRSKRAYVLCVVCCQNACGSSQRRLFFFVYFLRSSLCGVAADEKVYTQPGGVGRTRRRERPRAKNTAESMLHWRWPRCLAS